MEGDSAVSSFERSKWKINNCIISLKFQVGFYITQEDAMAEFQKTWIEKFSDYYENDRQYLNFMFVVMKNVFRIMKAKEVKWARRHVSDVSTFSFDSVSESGSEGGTILEITEDLNAEKPLEKILFDELKQRIKVRLSLKASLIFDLLLLNFSIKEIAVHAKCTAITVSNIKKREIWPAVKEVLNISDEKYAKMCTSTRLYLGRWTPEEQQNVPEQEIPKQETPVETSCSPTSTETNCIPIAAG